MDPVTLKEDLLLALQDIDTMDPSEKGELVNTILRGYEETRIALFAHDLAFIIQHNEKLCEAFNEVQDDIVGSAIFPKLMKGDPVYDLTDIPHIPGVTVNRAGHPSDVWGDEYGFQVVAAPSGSGATVYIVSKAEAPSFAHDANIRVPIMGLNPKYLPCKDTEEKLREESQGYLRTISSLNARVDIAEGVSEEYDKMSFLDLIGLAVTRLL